MGKDLTSKEYWDEFWGEGQLKHPTYNLERGVFPSIRLLLEQCITETRARLQAERLKVVDCGSGEGLIMRLLAEQFENIDVFGIEYSDAIEKSRKMAADLGLEFNLIRADLLQPWEPQYVEQFDIACSFGLIEHFENPEEVLSQLARSVKPGGMIISVIPNFNGLFNALWKFYDGDNYAYHVPIRHAELSALHEQVGLGQVRFYTLGIPVIPGVHNASTRTQKAVRFATKIVNGYVIRALWPAKQSTLEKRYPMVSTVACVGIK